MQPARQDLVLYQGDSRDIVVRLFARNDGGARVPLVPNPGDEFRIEIGSPHVGSRFAWSTKGEGNRLLDLAVTPEATTLSRRMRSRDTVGLGDGLTWSLARVPAEGERRTYIAGAVVVLAVPQAGVGDQGFDLTVDVVQQVVEVDVVDNTSNVAGVADALIQQAMTTLRGGAPTSTTIKTLADGIALRERAANKGQPGGYAPLDSAAKIPSVYLPPLAIKDSFPVASQAAMLALVAEKGDLAIRSDLSKTFILRAEPASTLANWLELATPTDAVRSVAGKTGVVTLSRGDVGLGNVNNTSDANKPVSTAQAAADAGVLAAAKADAAEGLALKVDLAEVGPQIQFTNDELNGTADVTGKLKAWLAIPGPKRFPKLIVPAVLKISESLLDYPFFSLDWQGTTLKLMPPQDTAEQRDSRDVRVPIPTNGRYDNLKILIPAGYRVRRPLALGAGSRGRGVRVYSEDQQPSGADASNLLDAGIIALQNDTILEDWSVEGYDFAAYAKGCKANRFWDGYVSRWKRGLVFLNTEGMRWEDIKYGPLADPSLLGQPGHNAVCNGSGTNDTRIWDLAVEQTGEHVVYLGDDAGAGGPKNFIIGNIRGAKAGQCFIKIRGGEDGVVHLSKGTDCSWGTSTGTNDDAVRLDRCKRVDVTADVRHSEPKVDGSPGFAKDASCNNFAWLNACSDISVTVMGDKCLREGIVIGDAPDPAFTGSYPVENIRIVLEVDAIGQDLVKIQMTQGAPQNISIEVRGAPTIGGRLVYHDAPTGMTRPLRLSGKYTSLVGPRIVDVQGTLLLQDEMEQVRLGSGPSWLDAAGRWYVTTPTREPSRIARAVDGVLSEINRLGAMSLFDFIHVMMVGTTGNAVIDLKTLADANVATISGALASTFVPYRGFVGDGSGVINLPLSPTDGATHAFKQDSCHAMWAVGSDVVGPSPDIGTNSGAAASKIFYADSRAAGDVFRYRINDATYRTFANADARGLYLMQRSGPSATEVWKDGVLKASDTTASTGVMGGRLCLFRDDTARGTREIGFVSAGAYLPPAVRKALRPPIAALLALRPDA